MTRPAAKLGPALASLLLVAAAGCSASQPAAPGPDAAALDPDAGLCNPTTAELGIAYDAGAQATGCKLQFDAHVSSGGGGDDCGGSTAHCDPGPVASWCACGARIVEGAIPTACGEDCWNHPTKLCVKGCVTLPSGEGRCVEDLAPSCLAAPPGRVRAVVHRDGVPVSGTLSFEGHVSSVSDRSLTVARPTRGAAAASQLRIVLYSPVRWRWGLAAGRAVQVTGLLDTEGCGDLTIRGEAGQLLFGLFRSHLGGQGELGFSVSWSTEASCPSEPLLGVTGADGSAASIPVGQSARVVTSWGGRDVWNLAIAPGQDCGAGIMVSHACPTGP